MSVFDSHVGVAELDIASGQFANGVLEVGEWIGPMFDPGLVVGFAVGIDVGDDVEGEILQEG